MPKFRIRKSNYLLLQEKQAYLCLLLPPELYIIIETYLYPEALLVIPLQHKSLPYEEEGESYTYNIYDLRVAFPSDQSYDLLEEFEMFMETLNRDGRPSLKRKRALRLKKCRDTLEEFLDSSVTHF